MTYFEMVDSNGIKFNRNFWYIETQFASILTMQQLNFSYSQMTHIFLNYKKHINISWSINLRLLVVIIYKFLYVFLNRLHFKDKDLHDLIFSLQDGLGKGYLSQSLLS